MSVVTQVNPPLWLYLPELSTAGLAHFMIWSGPEESLYWVLFTDTGEVRVLPNERVRPHANWTLGRLPPKAS